VFLRNPDRDLGIFLDVDHLEREGSAVNLMGHLRNDKAEQVLAGTFHPGSDRRQDGISLYFPGWVQPPASPEQTMLPASSMSAARPPVTTTTRAPRPRMTAGP
jgi:hypothetical protein